METGHMRNIKTKVVPVITGAAGRISRNYRKQPYWAPHKFFGKYECKSIQRVDLSWEISSHVLLMANTEEQ
jgi:hypothetical protein